MNKFTFMVCPHDTVHNPERWYRFEQYLIQKLNLEMQFDISLDMADFQENLLKSHIVYTNPSDRMNLLTNQGYVPLVKPLNIFDEAIFVASAELASPTLESLQGAKLATVQGSIVTSIALHMLKERGIAPGDIEGRDSWLAVISSIWNGQVEFGIVYKDTYAVLSDQSKGMVQVLATSDVRKAFHTIDISPVLADRQQEICAVLLGMDGDEQGRSVLGELGIEKWQPVTADELATMQQIMASFA